MKEKTVTLKRGVSRRRFLIAGGSFLALVAAGGITLDQVTVVRPEWPPAREGDPVPPRPDPSDPPFHKTPIAATFEERRELYLEWAAAQPTPEGRNAIWAEIVKLEAGPGPIDDGHLQWCLQFVDERNDCADFVVAGLLRLYFKHAGSEKVLPHQREDIERTLLDWQYWLDEPNPDLGAMELWTENHQILAFTAEYLAGQLFPGRTFTNVNQTGRWRMERARPRILRWIDWRVLTGFAEWDSIPYYPEDLAALLNLVDYCEDEELAGKAAMLVDLILFDMAVDSFYGQYGTSHGRVSAHHVKSAAGDSLVTAQALAWGLGRFQTNSNMGSVSLATSEKYRVPPVIEALGGDSPEEMTNYERHSINVTNEDAEKYGLSFEDYEDAMTWWAMGAFTHPKVIRTTLMIADDWNLWHYPDFKDFKGLAGALQFLRAEALASRLLDPDTNGILMSEANKVTYRTPDYMLSCAQDYRKGEKGYQQHIWQATLGPYAVVFVTNPDSLREDRHRPCYWSSNGRKPRAAQYKNVLVCLYDICRNQGLMEARHFAFTHAYFPRWAFDEVREVPVEGGGGWIFGRYGDGYAALYSHLPYEWQTEGPDAGQEVIAVGRRNAWICQCGRRAVDGSFDEFVRKVSEAPLEVEGLRVSYEAPGHGMLNFAWEGPLTVNGGEVPLRDYPRWENPYCRAEFNSQKYTITHDGMKLELDFARTTRHITG